MINGFGLSLGQNHIPNNASGGRLSDNKLLESDPRGTSESGGAHCFLLSD